MRVADTIGSARGDDCDLSEGCEAGEAVSELAVLQAVSDYPDSSLMSIVGYLDSTYDAVAPVVKKLVVNGSLKQKEDIVDHEWNYRLTDKGRERLQP